MNDEQGEAILREILSSDVDAGPFSDSATAATRAPSAFPEGAEKSEKASTENHAQWALGGNGRFMPIGATAPVLPAGVYEPFAVPGMWGVELLKVESDGIYELPDMATQTILDETKRFWASEDRYRKHKLLYKRGILLFGPPGGGKTVAVKMLIQELIKRDGIVVLVNNVQLAVVVLKALRRIEPKRNLIVVFEDIDEIIQYNTESQVLSMLDGENNIDNILHIGTTNYPEKLGARIINRPSRFDRLVYVGMPSDASRSAYLEQATNNGLNPEDLAKWTADTKGLSVAHLRELVASVYCLDQNYGQVVKRLQLMAVPMKTEDGMRRRKLGFNDIVGKKIAESELIAAAEGGGL